MPFLDHLEELRWRLLKSLAAILVGTLVGWWAVQHWDVIALLKAPIAPLLPGGRLVFTSPTEPFFITLKLAFALGLVLASPLVIYQAWAFLAPALYDRERRLIVPALTVGVVLFLAGASAAYTLVLPRALKVLFGFQRADLSPIITADNYFGFAAQLILAFGVVTELPLVVTLLASLGLVTPQFLTKNRRYALLIAAALAAFLTPPDALSMVLMMVPLLVLYEVSIWCAWIVTRRRARRLAREAAGSAAVLLLLLAGGVSRAASQAQPVQDTTKRGAGVPGQPGQSVQGRGLDSATAKRLGLPTAPIRTFPASDAVIDSLLKLKGYSITRYVADTMVVVGDSGVIRLTGEAFVDRDGTKLEADSIHYKRADCRLDAAGDPHLFDNGTTVIGDGMRYDTCLRRGTVTRALTDFQQGGATWFVVGNLAVDSGSTRLYGASSDVTSDDHPLPDYHFGTSQVKWLSKTVMVARPAVLFVHDVPVIWFPFIFQDIRPGRHSGMLVPRFGLNDLVRPTRGYQRHIANLGYYFDLGDHADLLMSGDWFAEHNVAVRAASHYRWLDRFVTGYLSYSRTSELDHPSTSTQLTWQHSQAFNSRTHFNANINYGTNVTVVQRNTVDPYVSTGTISSALNFDKRFDWGTLTIGGSRNQPISSSLGQGAVTQTFPTVSLTPSPVNITPIVTWSPAFSYSNQQTFDQFNPPGYEVVVGGVRDTLGRFYNSRTTTLTLATPLRVGPWNWTNSFAVTDLRSNRRVELVLPDAADSTTLHHLLFLDNFDTRVDWQTGINLPQLASGKWKLQPGLGILNSTSAGPFAIRNQFTGGRFIHQGKRLAFNLGVTPTLFGFFPGIGPFARFRHSIQTIVSYQYSPAAQVDPAFSHAIDPTGRSLNSRSDPIQTITLGLSQNIEAKFKPQPGDTSSEPQVKKIRLLSISTSALSYNFEQAKKKGLNGWQTQTITNTVASDLLRGFNFQMTHDLWDGQVGRDSSKFSPFLTSLSASFSINGATLRSIGGLLGLGGGQPQPGAPPTPIPGTGVPGQTPGFGGAGPYGPGGYGGGAPRGVYSPLASGGLGGGFHLNVSFTSNRIRPVHVVQPFSYDSAFGSGTQQPTVIGGNSQAGQRQLRLDTGFSPTPHWQVSWSSTYDLATRQFGYHYVRLERDLHRWHASFAFSKAPNGNFAFNFYISLIDQPDIKFDYDQQTFLNR